MIQGIPSECHGKEKPLGFYHVLVRLQTQVGQVSAVASKTRRRVGTAGVFQGQCQCGTNMAKCDGNTNMFL